MPLKERTARFAVATGVAIVILAVAPMTILMIDATAAGAESCTKTVSPSYHPDPNPSVTLTPVDERSTKPPGVDFGTARSPLLVAPYSFSPTGGPLPDPGQLAWAVTLVDGNRQFPSDKVGVTMTDQLGTLQVRVCLIGSGVPSGAYSGSLVISGSTIKPKYIPLTVTLKDNAWPVILGGMLVVGIAAVFFKWWMTALSDTSQDNAPSVPRFLNWAGSQWMTIFIAVGGAGIGVYVAKYANLASFQPSSRIPLWTATFTAVTSAALLTTAVGKATASVRISGLTPPNGPVGTPVTIAGQNLSGAAQVTFDGVPADPIAANANTATRIVTHVPVGATTGRVTVVTPAGTATSKKPFTVI